MDRAADSVRPMRAMIAAVLASVLLLGGCNTGPGIDHYVGILDTLDVPADWAIVRTQRRGPGEEFDCEPLITSVCPGTDRWYAVDGDLVAALGAAREMVEVSGFSVDEVRNAACDGPPSGSTCTLYASRGVDRISVSIGTPSRSMGLDNPPDADVIIRVTAQR
jgi:hypothetical protein